MFEISNNTNYNQISNNNMLMLSKTKANAMKRSFGYAGLNLVFKVRFSLTKKNVLEKSNRL